jgi:hypothetical protein
MTQAACQSRLGLAVFKDGENLIDMPPSATVATHGRPRQPRAGFVRYRAWHRRMNAYRSAVLKRTDLGPTL